MKIKFQLEKRESKFIKDQFLEMVTRLMGSKVVVDNECVEVDDKDEPRVQDLLKKSGVRFERQAQ